MFWKGNSYNKEGVLEYLIVFCIGGFGFMFLVDFIVVILVKVQLIFKLFCIVIRLCVYYKKGVVFVVEENVVQCLDVGNVVRLNLKF